MFLQNALLAIGIAALLAGCDTASAPHQLVIENVNIIDPIGGLTQNQQILIEDGVIADVADAVWRVAHLHADDAVVAEAALLPLLARALPVRVGAARG